jgi:hypothetical protein
MFDEISRAGVFVGESRFPLRDGHLVNVLAGLGHVTLVNCEGRIG